LDPFPCLIVVASHDATRYRTIIPRAAATAERNASSHPHTHYLEMIYLSVLSDDSQ